MENLQKYDRNIETLKQELETRSKDLEQQRILIEEDNIRLEGLRKVIEPSIKSQIMIDAINQSNIQVDKEIERNNKKIEAAEDEIKRIYDKIESNKLSLKEAIDKNKEEAKKDKAKAFASYSRKNNEFNKGIEKGMTIKLKLKAFSSGMDKELYKAASEESAEHLKHMKKLAKERNEAWKLYNEAAKDNDRILMDGQELLHKYNLKGKSKENEEKIAGEEIDEEEIDEDGRNEEIDEDEVDEDELKEKKSEIHIGRKGIIIYDGKEYKISEKVIKKGINIDITNDAELERFIKEEIDIWFEDKMSNKSRTNMKNLIKESILDTTILKAISTSTMDNKEKCSIIEQYANNANNANKGKSKKYDLDITYHMKELSKTRFWDRMFKRDKNILNEQEKVKILERGIKSERYGIGEITGEYKQSFSAKLINLLKGKRLPTVPVHKIDSLHKVASIYNNARYDESGKAIVSSDIIDEDGRVKGVEIWVPTRRDRDSFVKSIKNELKNNKQTVFNTVGLTKGEQTVLRDLTNQELNNDKYTGREPGDD